MENPMRRSATEALNELESRIARLESNTSRRTKSAAQKRTLTNARCIIMVEDLLMKRDKINLCFMHMDRAILKKCVQDFKNSLNDPMGSYLIRNVVETSSCASCVCITVDIDGAYMVVEDFENPRGYAGAMEWIEETILNLPNSIPMR